MMTRSLNNHNAFRSWPRAPAGATRHLGRVKGDLLVVATQASFRERRGCVRSPHPALGFVVRRRKPHRARGGTAMGVVVRYLPVHLTREQYDALTRRMEEPGAWPADGLALHHLFRAEGDLGVSEISRSAEQLTSFSEHTSLLNKVGVQFAGRT